jgi:hypothetical protein
VRFMLTSKESIDLKATITGFPDWKTLIVHHEGDIYYAIVPGCKVITNTGKWFKTWWPKKYNAYTSTTNLAANLQKLIDDADEPTDTERKENDQVQDNKNDVQENKNNGEENKNDVQENKNIEDQNKNDEVQHEPKQKTDIIDNNNAQQILDTNTNPYIT